MLCTHMINSLSLIIGDSVMVIDSKDLPTFGCLSEFMLIALWSRHPGNPDHPGYLHLLMVLCTKGQTFSGDGPPLCPFSDRLTLTAHCECVCVCVCVCVCGVCVCVCVVCVCVCVCGVCICVWYCMYMYCVCMCMYVLVISICVCMCV